MKEELLHFIWKFRLFSTLDLTTTDGEYVVISHPGQHNFNAGPDFLNARLCIADKLWVGHVEIHTLSSEWYVHGHHNDEKYENVILHVVYKDNKRVHLKQEGDLPVLELSQFMDHSYIPRYNQLTRSKSWVPCEKRIKDVQELVIESWKQRLAIQRLERKVVFIHELLCAFKGDWRQTAYTLLARNFGFKTNADAFEQLSHVLPIGMLRKHTEYLNQLEAILFGQAGFLDWKCNDPYYKSLVKEYQYLATKLNLAPMNIVMWNKLRMRPLNFPEVRLSQFANLIFSNKDVFKQLLRTTARSDLDSLFDVSASDYWETHSSFGKQTRKRKCSIGKGSVDNLIINTVVPLVFAYGRRVDDYRIEDTALELLESCQSEDNSIIRKWRKSGVQSENAVDSQALIELKNEFCTGKKCLNCGIGVHLLKA